MLFQFTKLHLNFQLWTNFTAPRKHGVKRFFRRKTKFSNQVPSQRRREGEEKRIRNYFAEARGNVLPSFPYLSAFHPFPLIERENRERSFNFAFDQHHLDEQLSLGRGVAPDNARRSMRFHAAFTERELNFKGNSFETSMPAKRAPCLGKTTFVPNTLASAYLSAHLGEALLHPRHPRKGGGKDWKERRILRHCVGYFKTRCFRGGGGEERIRGRGNKGLERAWNASAVCRPDTTREKDRWTTRLPSQPPAQRHLLPIAQLFPPTPLPALRYSWSLSWMVAAWIFFRQWFLLRFI